LGICHHPYVFKFKQLMLLVNIFKEGAGYVVLWVTSTHPTPNHFHCTSKFYWYNGQQYIFNALIQLVSTMRIITTLFAL